MPIHHQQTIYIIKVAVPVPMRQNYDYISQQKISPGTRVLVPFGNRKVVGIVLSPSINPTEKPLKSILKVIDDAPTISPQVLSLALWASEYYHHPIGDVMQSCLPTALRTGDPAENPLQLTQIKPSTKVNDPPTDDLLRRAPKQQILFRYIQQHAPIDTDKLINIGEELHLHGIRSLLASLKQKNLIEIQTVSATITKTQENSTPLNLNEDQQHCVESVLSDKNHYRPFLLHGITGSGKTEVYMSIIATNVDEQKQTLVLVPEISLTPELIRRFRQRFGNQVSSYHSAMSDKQRYQTWWLCRTGQVSIVLGTRSAIFLDFKNLATIIVDEEHDISFKQLEGYRYHARDLALKRASMNQIPIILGSATPSLETIHNVSIGKFSHLVLNQRFGKGGLPKIELVDMRSQSRPDSISLSLQQAIKATLDKKQQVILYINRRGYAPIAQCYDCGWQAKCSRCDAYMTFYQKTSRLLCHHCGKEYKSKQQCPNCAASLYLGGAGTQRIQATINQLFPDSRCIRFDRDEITTQTKLEQATENIKNQQYDIIIGTQLIVKGHDFSNVALVGVVDADQGLFSTDFRAPEYLLQQLVQVSGRAGRGDQPGKVIIQTHHIDNPFYQYVCHQDFNRFQKQSLIERTQASLPPFSHLALWRAESVKPMAAIHFLNNVKKIGEHLLGKHSDMKIQIMDSIPSPMEKRAGRFRAQLLVNSTQRQALHQLLAEWIAIIEKSKKKYQIRWSIDVDPKEMN